MLFDAGLDPVIGTDPDYISSAIGRFFLRKLFRLNIGPDDTLASKLNALVFQAADVHKVIVSHLHFDHIGYIKEVPQAEFLVSGEEWTQLSGPHPEIKFILREHIEVPGANWRQIEFTPSDDPFFAPFGAWYAVYGSPHNYFTTDLGPYARVHVFISYEQATCPCFYSSAI